MKTPNQTRSVRAGQPEPELSKLKRLWGALSEDAREYWRERLFSGAPGNTQPEIARDISAKLKVRLKWNRQVTDFKNFVERQDQMDEQAAKAAEYEARLRSEHPDWTKEQIREDLLKYFYTESRATGDAKLGLATIAADVSAEKISLDARKVALLEKKAAAFDRAQEILTKAKSSKGGITPETWQKVEDELHLMP